MLIRGTPLLAGARRQIRGRETRAGRSRSGDEREPELTLRDDDARALDEDLQKRVVRSRHAMAIDGPGGEVHGEHGLPHLLGDRGHAAVSGAPAFFECQANSSSTARSACSSA